MYYSSFGIKKIGDVYQVRNETASICEVLFTGTLEECELYIEYYQQDLYRDILRKYVRNIKQLRVWL